MDVALATCVDLPELDHDAVPLLAAFTRAGIDARWVAWDDPEADFSSPRVTVLRSTWNYALHIGAFLRWAEHTAARSSLVNGHEVVRWNHHKGYLLDLEARGVAIAPTELVRVGDERSLSDILEARRWDDAVVKPAVSAGSYRTLRVHPGDLRAGEGHLAGLIADRDALVQRYLPSVEGHGERSLIWIDGELTHAIRKSPRFGGDDEEISEALPISDSERELAAEALTAASLPLTYARIDMAPGPEGPPVLMELELMEPSLFFDRHPPALTRFVDAIAKML